MEGKYIKQADKDVLKICYIKKIKDFYYDFDDNIRRILLDDYCVDLDFDKQIIILENDVLTLERIFYDFSFTTKEEFMNSCNKVMEKIQKGVEK